MIYRNNPSIGIPCLLTILLIKFEVVHFTTSCFLRHLIWVFTVCKGLHCLQRPVCSILRVIFRIESLESTLQEKEKQLSEEREKFQKLKEDFKYNLRLLGERDQELDRYDTSFAGKDHKVLDTRQFHYYIIHCITYLKLYLVISEGKLNPCHAE